MRRVGWARGCNPPPARRRKSSTPLPTLGAACHPAGIGARQPFRDEDGANVTTIGAQRAAGSAIVALARPMRPRRARALQGSQFDAGGAPDQFPQPLRGTIAEIALMGAPGSAARLWGVEADKAKRLPPHAHGVSVDHAGRIDARNACLRWRMSGEAAVPAWH